tara:strand:- start:1110 stop:2216 length:1107 start_codon:yes stop_codon:yes gene_type:complete
MNKYYEEFIRYYKMAKKQQSHCNLGILDHKDCDIEDDLMKEVELYDVVERKYAGFSQIINDIFYQDQSTHPYYTKIQMGFCTNERREIIKKWKGTKHDLKTWLYIFMIHRLTGSAINYAKKPSGYHNTILFDLWQCSDITDIKELVKSYDKTFYTSVGYQFPKFPKVPDHLKTQYKRGGDYFIVNYLPSLINLVIDTLERKQNIKFRELANVMYDWNNKMGLVRYKFQYAAFLADIADWFPDLIDTESDFFYGSNAIECAKLISDKEPIDDLVKKIYEDTGSLPYNTEDVMCDYIRWIENYIKPGNDYDHLDRDKVWNSCKITDHPKGRQKKMLSLDLISSFNDLDIHPSDTYILDQNNLSIESYKNS